MKYRVKSMLACSMLFLFAFTSLTAQPVAIERSHTINTVPLSLQDDLNATGTLNVIAIMVEFQPDSNRFTTGNGTFGPGSLPYLENNATYIDPLPHDRAYFEAHLEFTKNYFLKSSDGKLTINYQVLPQVYRLDEPMAAYSPTGENFTNEKIAMLAQDAWAKVEESGGFDATGLDPENTSFIIFHAGVGRDVELTGTSLTITPQDIPSLYLRKQDLSSLLEDPSFNGFEINNGTFRITNSMIIPRTESRPGEDVTGTEFVFPLSINGLLSASIGSHLGLPDLFNVENGAPAIGRFGLMDGAGFFSYNGLFPPEPSAWEKIYLGWQNPVEIEARQEQNQQFDVPAAGMDSDSNIYRISLSASEYFLVENRYRDLDDDGVTLTIRRPDGTFATQTFTNKDEAFIFQESGFDSLFVPGTIIDVSEPDFSLPGGFDVGRDDTEGTDDDRNLNGGILIWHIDEGVIRNGLNENGVNTNPKRRGVDLEEADGAQDIGPAIPGTLDNTASFGTAFDFWWSGNNFTVIDQNNQRFSFYENRFSSDTRPDNRSNTGAPSYFELDDFSDNLPVASFVLKALTPEGAPGLVLDQKLSNEAFYNRGRSSEYERSFPLAIDLIDSDNGHILLLPSQNGLFSLHTQTGSVQQLGNEPVRQPFKGTELALAFENPANQEEILLRTYALNNDTWVNSESFSLPDNEALLSGESEHLIELDYSTYAVDLNQQIVISDFRNGNIQQSARLSGDFAQVEDVTVSFSLNGLSDFTVNESDDGNRIYAGTIELHNQKAGYFILTRGTLIHVNPDRKNPFLAIYESEEIGWPAIIDLNNDGNLDFIFTDYSTNEIIGINANGAFLEGFPLLPDEGTRFTGTPLVTDLESDGIPDLILSYTDDVSMNLKILDQDAAVKPYSPLYIGGINRDQGLPLNPVIGSNRIYAVSPQGDLKAWEFENLSDTGWGFKYGPHPFNKVQGLLVGNSQEPMSFEVLNKSETYNWPNPADLYTNIRFQVTAPGGSVNITVIDLSGDVIYSSTHTANGEMAEEIRLDTSQWANGAYFAMVKAKVNGKTESKLVKIGVIH